MKNIPEFDFDISQATQYILESELAQKALEKPPFPNYANICRDIIKQLSKLSSNCNMPEFTNHGLQHICSLIKRATEWGLDAGWLELSTQQKRKNTYALSPQEAGYLLLALMLHDIGMLSQDPQELPDGQTINTNQGFLDIASWVRKTHVIRLPKLVNNLLKEYLDSSAKDTLRPHIDTIVHIAASHNFWPWDAAFVTPIDMCQKTKIPQERLNALNAIVAVCDLLDEDSNRCDSVTLLAHKYGSTVNRAHWYRHALTISVEGVKRDGIIDIRFRNLPGTPDDFQIVFRALRNHFRLTMLYNDCLKPLHATIEQINFHPGSGLPEVDSVSEQLNGWKKDIDFCYCITARLLETFMPEARNESTSEIMNKKLRQIGIETMDLSRYDDFLHPKKPYMPEEKLILAIVKELDSHGNKRAEMNELNAYAKDIVEQAYLSGMVGKVNTLCTFLLEQIGKYINPEEWYWIFVYKLLLSDKRFDDEFVAKISDAQNKGCYSKMIRITWSLLQLSDVEWMRQEDMVTSYSEELENIYYENLKQDTPTILLIKLLIDVLYYHLEKLGEEHVALILDKIGKDQPSLAKMIEGEKNRLRYQLGHAGATPELLDEKEQLLAKIWESYQNMDMIQLNACLKELSKEIDQNHPNYVALQKIYNVTRFPRERATEEKKREDEKNSRTSMREGIEAIGQFAQKHTSALAEEDSRNTEKTDSMRLQQQEKDVPSNGLHANRIERIHDIVCEMELKFAQNQAVHEDAMLNQLIILERMHALRSWDLVNLIVLRRDEALYHKLVGLSVELFSASAKSYRDLQLTKSIFCSVEGQMTCPNPKKEEYWIGTFGDLEEKTKDTVIEQLLNWKYPISQAVIRSWLEELGGFVSGKNIEAYVNWIANNCAKTMESIVIYYAFPMTVCKYLFSNPNMNDSLWAKLERAFMDTLENENYWHSHNRLCSQMLLNLPEKKQIQVLEYLVEHLKERPYYANVIINVAVDISKNNEKLASECVFHLEKRYEKYPKNKDYAKYKQLIERDKLSALPQPNAQAIIAKLGKIFAKRVKEENVNSSKIISMIEQATELLNNENWAAVKDEDLDAVLNLILGFHEEQREHLMANEVFSLFRMLYLLAKDERSAQKVIKAAFKMNICYEDVSKCIEVLKKNKSNMFLPTNLNNGYTYGFLVVIDNLIEYVSDEQLESVATWTNLSYSYAEEISEYHYAYFWIYLLKYAKQNRNFKLEILARIGIAQLNLKLTAQQEKRYEKKEDTLFNVLFAWKSYCEIQKKKDNPLDMNFPVELHTFEILGARSNYNEKRDLIRFLKTQE